MIDILFVPFPVTGDVLVQDSYTVYKVCKSQIELEECISSATISDEEVDLVLSYIIPVNYDYSTQIVTIGEKKFRAFLHAVDLDGNISRGFYSEDSLRKWKEELDKQVENFDWTKYPSMTDITNITYSDESLEKRFVKFTRELRYQLRSEFFTYFSLKKMEKMDKSILTENSSSILTCLDLFRYLIKSKYTFLGDVCVVVKVNAFESPVDRFLKNVENLNVPIFNRIEVYNTDKRLNLIKNLLDNVYIKDTEDEDAIMLKDFKDIDSYNFITVNGFNIKINTNGELSVSGKDEALGLQSKSILSLN